MRWSSLRATLHRVARLEAGIQKRQDGVDPAELVRILHEGRARAARGDIHPVVTVEEAREHRRVLLQTLRGTQVGRPQSWKQ